jgi:hypothetical protein
MKRIELNHGMFTVVDDEDFEWLNQWKWTSVKPDRVRYVVRSLRKKGGGFTTVRMHRAIMKATRLFMVDHKNSNGLDNRRCNLRACTASENAQNRRLNTNSSSGYKGVSWHKGHRKWQVSIGDNGKSSFLGVFFCIIKAAKAYDKAAKRRFGQFARLNFPNL